MDLTFQEKSLWVSLLSIGGLYGYYFFAGVSGAQEPSLSAMLWTMIGIIVLLIVVEIVCHAVIGSFHAPEKLDERDRLIEARAGKISHFILAGGVIVVLGRMLIGGALQEADATLQISAFDTANLLLFVLVLSELVHVSGRIFFYRRGF